MKYYLITNDKDVISTVYHYNIESARDEAKVILLNCPKVTKVEILSSFEIMEYKEVTTKQIVITNVKEQEDNTKNYG
jgi:hypothetical protein